MESQQDLAPGEHLQHYRIESVLGKGAMGTVYLAHDETLNRKVAVKVLSPALCDVEGFLERFHREAESVARLRHPNILQIYTIGEDRGHHFFAMEFVEGQSLGERLEAKSKLDTQEALSILEQVAKGLMSAHQAGVIHRDIKPSNIMIDASGRATITDFGIAKMEMEEAQSHGSEAQQPPTAQDADAVPGTGSRITMAGEVVGTPEYMSPEQALGQPVDQRADIYALGTMAYEMLTGRLPFRAPSFYQLANIKSKNLPPPLWEGANVTDIQQRLQFLVTRSLEPDPQKRYEDCRGFLKGIVGVQQAIERQEELAERRDLTIQLTSAALHKEATKAPLIPRSLVRVSAVVIVTGMLFAMLVALWKGLSSSMGGFEEAAVVISEEDLGQLVTLEGHVRRMQQYGDELWVELGHRGGKNWLVMGVDAYFRVPFEKLDRIRVEGRAERDPDPEVGGFLVRVEGAEKLRMVQVRMRDDMETMEMVTRKPDRGPIGFSSLKNFPGKWRKVGGEIVGIIEEENPDGIILELHDGMHVGGVWVPGPVFARMGYSLSEGDYVEVIGVASATNSRGYRGWLFVWSPEDIYVE